MYGKNRKEMKANYILTACLALLSLASCDKVSPTGILIGSTNVDDRVKMSMYYYDQDIEGNYYYDVSKSESQEYSVLIGSDSHVYDSSIRIDEMFEEAYSYGDLFVAHCGDLADTQPEMYTVMENSVDYWMSDSVAKTYGPDTEPLDFFPVVGNHDVTHNGFAYFTTIMGTSTYVVNVKVDQSGLRDVHLFLDSASGTMGTIQLDWIMDRVEDDGLDNIRNFYVYTHTNIFRATSGHIEFASTYPREETYSLLNWFNSLDGMSKAQNCIVFCGHIHQYDYYRYGGVDYYNLPSMSERNNPAPGQYLLRLTCHRDGTNSCDLVYMHTSNPKYDPSSEQ